MVLDSGASHMVLFEPGRDAILRRLMVGRLRFDNLPVARVGTRYRAANGLFPARLFLSITVDNDSGLVTLVTTASAGRELHPRGSSNRRLR
jgi:hypothetical protein